METLLGTRHFEYKFTKSSQLYNEIGYLLLTVKKKKRHREIKQLTQSLAVMKWQSQDFKPKSLTSEFLFLTVILYSAVHWGVWIKESMEMALLEFLSILQTYISIAIIKSDWYALRLIKVHSKQSEGFQEDMRCSAWLVSTWDKHGYSNTQVTKCS